MPNMCSYICNDNDMLNKSRYRTACGRIADIPSIGDNKSRWVFCPWCGSPIVYLNPNTGENMFSVCDGCKHKGQYENEVENGYPSPCTGCYRRSVDRFET